MSQTPIDPLTDQTGDLDAMEAHDAVDTESEAETADDILDEAALPNDPLAVTEHDLEAEIHAVISPAVAAAGDDDDDDDDEHDSADPTKAAPKKSAYMVSQELIDKPLTLEDLMDDGEL